MIHRPPAWGLGALWTLFTAVGFMIGLAAGFALAHSGPPTLILPLGVGTCVGLAQRPVLRMFIERAEGAARWPEGLGGWFAGSAAGLLAAGFLAVSARSLLSVADLGLVGSILVLVGLAAVGGGLAGALQSRTLRGHVLRPTAWIPASTVSWVCAALAVELTPDVPGVGPFLMMIGTGGLALGLVSALAMMWLWMRPVPSAAG